MAKKEPVPNRQYSAEFKTEAVRLGESIGSNPAAERLGIPQSTMSNWLRQARGGGLEQAAQTQAPLVVKRPVGELEAEVSRLRREVASLKVDNEILRKATVYFAKESR